MQSPGAIAIPTSTKSIAGWLDSIVDLALSVAYIDGLFHPREQAFLRQHLAVVLQQIEQNGTGSPADRARLRNQWAEHCEQVLARLHAEVAALVDVPAAGGESYVPTKLKVRAVTIFRGLDPTAQAAALELVQALMHADGVVTEPERLLYQELAGYFTATPAPAPSPAPAPAKGAAPAPMIVTPTRWLPLEVTSHPVLDPLEMAYSPHPVERQAQLAWDLQLVHQAIHTWTRQRELGHGRLAGVSEVAKLPAGSRFLDGHVYAMRIDRPTELVVLGDLHGCYSCLKGALLQSRFIERVWAHQYDPAQYPDVKLVLLGDYIDRGRFSFDGVLRTVLQLFVTMPDHVFVLRGNHEYFVRRDGQIHSGVHPAEAIASLRPYAPPALLDGYQLLFEQMPTSLVVDRTLFVHGGIPRDDTFAERCRELSSLNDPDLRFQMMWSDPALTDHVPVDLQRVNPRFSFGRRQFRAFLDQIGCDTLIRGHEQQDRGFEKLYDLGDRLLLSLFSAGGHDNEDLPVDASYRSVTPMALTIAYGAGTPVATPWPIEYRPFTFEPHNGLYRPLPLLDFRYS